MTTRTSKARMGKISDRLKPYAWRATGLYVWLTMLAALFGFYDSLSRVEITFVNSLVGFLSSIGFAPVNREYLPNVFKICWILIITGLKPLELVGLTVYVVTFPLWAPVGGVLLLLGVGGGESKVEKKSSEDKAEEKSSGGLSGKEKERSRVFAFTLLFLAAWFILYGGATEKRQIYPGVFIMGIFFLLLIYRQFVRARPSLDKEIVPFRWVHSIVNHLLDLNKDYETKEFRKAADVRSALDTNRCARKTCAAAASQFRERSAQRRIALFVLADFIISLIMMGAAAILLWALVIKATASIPIPLLLGIKLSAAHFLPGMQRPEIDFDVPQWATYGTAATAWVLFVLYIGPASSFIPGRQREYIKRLSASLALLRKTSIELKVRRRFLLVKLLAMETTDKIIKELMKRS